MAGRQLVGLPWLFLSDSTRTAAVTAVTLQAVRRRQVVRWPHAVFATTRNLIVAPQPTPDRFAMPSAMHNMGGVNDLIVPTVTD